MTWTKLPVFGNIGAMPRKTSLTAVSCRAARVVLGLSQAELAVACRLSERTVRNFEQRKGRPHPATVMRLSEILEVSLAAKGMRFDALLAPVRVSEPTVLEDLLSHVDAALDILHEFVAEVRVSDVLPADLSRDRLMTVLVDDLGALLQWMETTLDREVEWAAKLQPSPTE